MSNPAGRCDFVVLRTPLLPVEALLDWSSGLGARNAWERGEPLGPALAADRAILRDRLTTLLARPEVREAVFVASPSLDDAIPHWQRDPDSDKGQRAELALVRYLGRMATRPTPFGLFAGVSLGAVGAKTRLTLQGSDARIRHTRLDNDYLFALLQALTGDPAHRDTLRYVPNDSLTLGGGRARYVEARLDGTRRQYHLVSADDSIELRQILARASRGGTRGELALELSNDEIEPGEASSFVDELIAAQILIPQLALPITGEEPLPALLRQLRDHPTLGSAAEVLATVDGRLSMLDRAGLTNVPERYREVARTLESLPAKVELATLFQVDLAKVTPSLVLGEAVMREIHRGIDLLHRISPRSHDNSLSRFRVAFQERYETREVPLLEALDEEVGLGEHLAATADPSPLLRGLPFVGAVDEQQPWGVRQRHLLTLLGRALQEGQDEIVLQQADLERLAVADPAALPAALEASVTVLAPSSAAIDRGDFRLWFQGASGPSGARYSGRFCHLLPALTKQVQGLLRLEEGEEPDAIFAELVHLPEARLGNILLRPVLRSHEITYLGRSGAPEERQIPAGDLLLSVQGARFVLRSARLGRRIIPRLTTAHNFEMGLGVYRFLCMMQIEGVVGGVGWTWGPLAAAPFLPRIRTGRIILSPRCWTLTQDECTQLGATRGEARYREIQEWRGRRRLPRWITIRDSDNRLPLDLDNPLSIDALMHEIKGCESATLEELFVAPEDLPLEGSDGRYTHEIVVPIPYREAAPIAAGQTSVVVAPAHGLADAQPPAGVPKGQLSSSPRRRFAPGSEWLYAKLYTSPAMADEILTEVIRPVTTTLLESGAATGWFFIRYADPEQHLRWRLKGDPDRLREEGAPAVEAAAARLLDGGNVWRVQFDTYQREVERYGGPAGIALSEQIFQIDSEAVLDLVEMLEPGDAGLDERWRLALYGAHRLMDDVGLDLAARREQTRRWSVHALQPWSSVADLRHRIAKRWRKERPRLEQLLAEGHDPDGDLAPGIALFQERSQRLAPVIAELRRLEGDGELSELVTGLVGSYVHMHLNRLLRSAPNHHEAVVYDFLSRLYDTRLARGMEKPRP